MYLSEIILNANNPKARKDLKSPYELHRTLCSGFGQEERPRVLFRQDARKPKVLMVSEREPDFSKSESEGRILRGRSKIFQPDLQPGRKLRFHLRANPTKKTGGSRLGLEKPDEQTQWLMRKAGQHGFRLLHFAIVDSDVQRTSRPNSSDMVHLAVDYQGVLEVVDTELFTKTLTTGIGSAKAFGFGMLCVAPA